MEGGGNNIGHVLTIVTSYWVWVHGEFIILFTLLLVYVLGRKSKQQLNTHMTHRLLAIQEAQDLPGTTDKIRQEMPTFLTERIFQ